MIRTLLGGWFLVWCVGCSVSRASEVPGFDGLIHRGRVLHEPISEMSGIVRSRTYPGIWWVQNDSGSGPALFPIGEDGGVVMPPSQRARYHGEEEREGTEPWPGLEVVLAENVDWEDLALFDGRIYIADMGNNRNTRRDLGVYVLPEPNPRKVSRARVLARLSIQYPDQHGFPGERLEFDCEGIFFFDGRLYFLTKHRQQRTGRTKFGTALYRLDSMVPGESHVLTKIEEHQTLGIPTSACLSPSGNHLAVLTYHAIHVFDRPSEGDRWLSGSRRSFALPMATVRQVEGICWDDEKTLRFNNEQRDLYSVELKWFRSVPGTEGDESAMEEK